MDTKDPHYLGHRTRLRERFLKSPESLADYEILELILFGASVRRDVKPLAKRLLKEFKSLAGVFSASPEKLKKIQDVGDTTLSTLYVIKESLARVLREDLQKSSLIDNTHKVINYCKTLMAHLDVEHFRLLFLDTKGGLIADELQQKGTVDHAILYPREIVKRALELGAASLIMVHNHPSGYTTPSQGDKDITQRVKSIAHDMGIRLLDHFIIGKYEWFSFRGQGWL